MKEAFKRITRDDTEHGQEYYSASYVDAWLAQPAQEPVVEVIQDMNNPQHLYFALCKLGEMPPVGTKFYTATPQRTTPMQPVIPASNDDVARFKENAIVTALLEHGNATGLSLNELRAKDFTDEDWMQFSQLIGYSVDGYGELSFVTAESYAAAQLAASRAE